MFHNTFLLSFFVQNKNFEIFLYANTSFGKAFPIEKLIVKSQLRIQMKFSQLRIQLGIHNSCLKIQLRI